MTRLIGNLVVDEQITAGKKILFSPQVSAPTAVQGLVYFDDGVDKLKVSENGSTFVDLGSAGWERIGTTLSPITAGDNLDMEFGFIQNVTNPVNDQDVATKAYVDANSATQDIKASVIANTATFALPANTYNNGVAGVGATITGNVFGALPAQDGITLVNGNRLLVRDQINGFENGIYTVTDIGSISSFFILTRATDADSSFDISDGMYVFVEQGTSFPNTAWVMTTDNPIIVGTSNLIFTQYSGLGQVSVGTGLLKTGNLIELNAIKTATRVTTTTNIILSGLQTIDGVLLVTGDRVLVKDQTLPEENGIYIADTIAWIRSFDTNSSLKVTSGLIIFVQEGSIYADSGWMLSTDSPIVLETTGLSFTQFTVDTTVLRTFGNQSVTSGIKTFTTGTTLDIDSGATLDINSGATLSILGSAASVNVTGTNLSTLTAGTSSDASSLHTHNSLRILASDPGSPVEGDLWYNSTSKQWKGYDGTSIRTIG